MRRAVVIIGVQKAGDFPKLMAVNKCVSDMSSWAKSQGIPDNLIKTITDASGDVTPELVKTAINELLKDDGLEQLIVYFTGHGIVNNLHQFQLLSGAPGDPDAAINVEGSLIRARFCGIPYVLFISDACRTASKTIQQGAVEGCLIFPSPGAEPPENPADVIYATSLGTPAFEVKDPALFSTSYRSIFTETLVTALQGKDKDEDLLDPDADNGGFKICSGKLGRYLARKVPGKTTAFLGALDTRSQVPSINVLDPGQQVISRISTGAEDVAVNSNSDALHLEAEATSTRVNLASGRINVAIGHILATDGRGLESALSKIPVAEPIVRKRDIFSSANRRFCEDVRFLSKSFGRMNTTTGCGFKIRGAKVVKCTGAKKATILNEGATVEADVAEGFSCSYLLEFQNGSGSLLPAVGGFLASLTFVDDKLIDVAYEPSQESKRWSVFENNVDSFRSLRAAVSAASRVGSFVLSDERSKSIGRSLQIMEGIDLSLALYAARAYQAQGDFRRIVEMANVIQSKNGFCPFDIALFSRQMNDQRGDSRPMRILPFLPMLAPSWALLSAFDVNLLPGLSQVFRHVQTDSFWTLLDAGGVRLVGSQLQSEAVR